MGLYSGVGIVCQPLIGPWIDAIGKKPFMLLGVALLAVSALLALTAPAVGLLALVRALQGLAYSAFFVANFSYVIDLIPPSRRGWALGIYGVSGLASTAVAPLVGEWVIRRFGFRPLFGFAIVLAIAAGVLVLPTRERPRTDLPPVQGWESLREGLRGMWERQMVLGLFFGLGSGTLFAFLPTFAESLGVRTLAIFYTAYAGAAMVVRVAGGRLIDTRGRRAVIVPSMFVQAGGAAVLAALAFLTGRGVAAPALVLVTVTGLASGGAHGFVYPGLAALVTDYAPAARRAAIIGVFSAMWLVGQTGGAVAFGYVAHHLGYTPTWTALTLVLLIGAVLSVELPREKR